MTATLTRILNDRLVAVVRTDGAEGLNDVVSALVDGGVSVVEITLTIPDAIPAIRRLADTFGSRILLGAGTVLDPASCHRVIDAGAAFVVSPVVRTDVIDTAKRRGVVVMPGAYTPTEILAAWDAGADVVKIFPADVLGPNYFKAVRGPLPHVRLMPTGGVDLATAGPFLDAGACCLGVGGKLVDAAAVRAKEYGKLTAVARSYRKAVPLLSPA
jgi:2-dehydro-3-deoxyphosphogluconate aldolase/(4S)-4-hydroxy-2-oxoglutarate aldolase